MGDPPSAHEVVETAPTSNTTAISKRTIFFTMPPSGARFALRGILTRVFDGEWNVRKSSDFGKLPRDTKSV